MLFPVGRGDEIGEDDCLPFPAGASLVVEPSVEVEVSVGFAFRDGVVGVDMLPCRVGHGGVAVAFASQVVEIASELGREEVEGVELIAGVCPEKMRYSRRLVISLVDLRSLPESS